MNLDDLRTVQVDERRSDNLQPLPDSFYRDVATYIDELRAERTQAAQVTNDPFGSDEVRRLTDEIETAEEVVEAIYERRVSKVVKRASLTAAGMPADTDGLTDEESALFGELVDVIEANREAVLDVFATDTALAQRDGSSPSSSERPNRRRDDNDTPESIDETEGTGDRNPELTGEYAESTAKASEQPERDTPSSDTKSDRVTVRVTRDVGEIFGVDQRVYTLSAEDVVTLPIENAQPLIDRDAAERIQ